MHGRMSGSLVASSSFVGFLNLYDADVSQPVELVDGC